MQDRTVTTPFIVRISIFLYVVGLMAVGSAIAEYGWYSEFGRIDYYVMFLGAGAGLFFTIPLALAFSGIVWVFTGKGL